ncbi:MAG: metal ABC transporter permease [Alphaproteobacteria bacterium]
MIETLLATLTDYFVTPFSDYGFMRRALAACLAISASAAPLGLFLMMRRMTLMGDAMSHAILPGVSLAFVVAGVSLWHMTFGGLIAGLLIAMIAGAISRYTPLKEDASFTGIYIIALALGVMMITARGSAIDLMHMLFGNVLAVDAPSLFLITGVASISVMTLAVIYRGLVMECCDPVFLMSVKGRGGLYHQIFLMLVVLNLVAAFQVLGSLRALGLMILPAISARFWVERLDSMLCLSVVLAIVASCIGLLLSYHVNVPSGPSIVLVAGGVYVLSLMIGRQGSILARYFPRKHYNLKETT